jgi:hypothetical protein
MDAPMFVHHHSAYIDLNYVTILRRALPFISAALSLADNAVRRTLDQVLSRGDPDELEGFCAALTDLAVTADESGDFSRMFSEVADKQLRNA